MTHVDHLVYAVPDLAAAVVRFTADVGVAPQPGGRHIGRGTANYLVGLGGRSYLEIIGPDPDGDEPDRPRPFGVGVLLAPKLVTWAVATEDLDATVARARAAGYDPGDPATMSRQTPAGELLEWRLTPDRVGRPSSTGSDGHGRVGGPSPGLGGVVPFVIDWGTSRHPSEGLDATLELAELELATPDPEQLRAVLAALGVRSPVTIVGAHEPALRATLAAPRTSGQPTSYTTVG